MKCWAKKGGWVHLELDVDEASEIALALMFRSGVKVLKMPNLAEMSDRIGQACRHILSTPAGEPQQPDQHSPATPTQAGTPPGK